MDVDSGPYERLSAGHMSGYKRTSYYRLLLFRTHLPLATTEELHAVLKPYFRPNSHFLLRNIETTSYYTTYESKRGYCLLT